MKNVPRVVVFRNHRLKEIGFSLPVKLVSAVAIFLALFSLQLQAKQIRPEESKIIFVWQNHIQIPNSVSTEKHGLGHSEYAAFEGDSYFMGATFIEALGGGFIKEGYYTTKKIIKQVDTDLDLGERGSVSSLFGKGKYQRFVFQEMPCFAFVVLSGSKSRGYRHGLTGAYCDKNSRSLDISEIERVLLGLGFKGLKEPIIALERPAETSEDNSRITDGFKSYIAASFPGRWEILRPVNAKTKVSIPNFTKSSQSSFYYNFSDGIDAYVEYRIFHNQSGEVLEILYFDTGRDDTYTSLKLDRDFIERFTGSNIRLEKRGNRKGFLGNYDYVTMRKKIGDICLGVMHNWDPVYGTVGRGKSHDFQDTLFILHCDNGHTKNALSRFNEITSGVSVSGYKSNIDDEYNTRPQNESANVQNLKSGGADIEMRLRKLQKLEDEGLISEQEARKKRIEILEDL